MRAADAYKSFFYDKLHVNALKLKIFKGELFLLANDTENEIVTFTCKQNKTANQSGA